MEFSEEKNVLTL